MATISQNRATAASITCTVTSLADGGYRCSAVVDNTTNLYMDAQLNVSIQAGAPTADGKISVFAYGGMDGTTIYDGGLNGANETITWGTTPSTSSVEGFNQLKLLTVLSVDSTDDNNDIEATIGSVAAAFGGILPARWGLVVLNETGATLNATGTNNTFDYVGIKYDSA